MYERFYDQLLFSPTLDQKFPKETYVASLPRPADGFFGEPLIQGGSAPEYVWSFLQVLMTELTESNYLVVSSQKLRMLVVLDIT